MIDLVHFVRISINSRLLVSENSVVLPRLLKELVHDVNELFCHSVSLIVLDLLLQAERFRSALKIGRNYVPSNAPIGDLIERAKLPG